MRRESFLLLIFFALQSLAVADEYRGSRFDEVWAELVSDTYGELPQYRINRKHFGPAGRGADNRVLQAGKRTLTSRQDFYDFPDQQKLFQANGICFAGEWIIDQQSHYTGQLSQGTRTPAIVRISTALNGTKQHQKRALGMAIKLFPGGIENARVETINLFVMHTLGGVKTRHVLDLTLDNEPELGSLPPWSQLRTALRLRKDFERADREVSGNEKGVVNFRPVFQLLMGLDSNTAPTWIQLQADPRLPRIDAKDFREELRVHHYPENKLIWKIYSAEGVRGEKKSAEWQNLGKLVLTADATSRSCDQRLHFHHPRVD